MFMEKIPDEIELACRLGNGGCPRVSFLLESTIFNKVVGFFQYESDVFESIFRQDGINYGSINYNQALKRYKLITGNGYLTISITKEQTELIKSSDMVEITKKNNVISWDVK